MESGPPPAVFYAGLNNRHDRRFMSAAVAACNQLGIRGVLVAPPDGPVPDSLPENVARFDYAPFTWLVPRCRVLVHHGGRGTASQALAAGVPHVVSPMTFGQVDTACRLEKLGVARLIAPRRLSARALATAMRSLTDSPEVQARCREYAARCAESDPLADTCDLVEELVGQDRVGAMENVDRVR
jgi:UDP:flavonoid glycosyltransferase YjiC (YdhE family)